MSPLMSQGNSTSRPTVQIFIPKRLFSTTSNLCRCAVQKSPALQALLLSYHRLLLDFSIPLPYWPNNRFHWPNQYTYLPHLWVLQTQPRLIFWAMGNTHPNEQLLKKFQCDSFWKDPNIFGTAFCHSNKQGVSAWLSDELQPSIKSTILYKTTYLRANQFRKIHILKSLFYILP